MDLLLAPLLAAVIFLPLIWFFDRNERRVHEQHMKELEIELHNALARGKPNPPPPR